jgi:hypothetical protein
MVPVGAAAPARRQARDRLMVRAARNAGTDVSTRTGAIGPRNLLDRKERPTRTFGRGGGLLANLAIGARRAIGRSLPSCDLFLISGTRRADDKCKPRRNKTWDASPGSPGRRHGTAALGWHDMNPCPGRSIRSAPDGGRFRNRTDRTVTTGLGKRAPRPASRVTATEKAQQNIVIGVPAHEESLYHRPGREDL